MTELLFLELVLKWFVAWWSLVVVLVKKCGGDEVKNRTNSDGFTFDMLYFLDFLEMFPKALNGPWKTFLPN